MNNIADLTFQLCKIRLHLSFVTILILNHGIK